MTETAVPRLSPSGPFQQDIVRTIVKGDFTPPNNAILAGASLNLTLFAADPARAASWADVSAALSIQETSGAPNSVLVEWIVGGVSVSAPLTADLTVSKVNPLAYPAQFPVAAGAAVVLRVTAGAGNLSLLPLGLIAGRLTTP